MRAQTRVNAQLVEDIAEAMLHGVLTDLKLFGDFTVGIPATTADTISPSRGERPNCGSEDMAPRIISPVSLPSF